jgi:hypothetical protein
VAETTRHSRARNVWSGQVHDQISTQTSEGHPKSQTGEWIDHRNHTYHPSGGMEKLCGTAFPATTIACESDLSHCCPYSFETTLLASLYIKHQCISEMRQNKRKRKGQKHFGHPGCDAVQSGSTNVQGARYSIHCVTSQKTSFNIHRHANFKSHVVFLNDALLTPCVEWKKTCESA